MFDEIRLGAIGALLLTSLSSAQTYYSVDTVNDKLVAVDVDTGLVTYLGPLQADLENVDLAWQMGALYAQTWNNAGGNMIRQIVVDGHYLAFTLPGGALHGGGYSVGVGALGGIASDGTLLHLAYSQSNPNDNYAGSFGSVQACWDGTILPTAPTSPPVFDIDSLAYAFGQFWGIDVRVPGVGYRLYRGTSSTGVTTHVGGSTDYDETTNPVDLEFYSNTEFVAVTQNGLQLVRISRTNGSRGLITPLTGLEAGGALKGIARRPDPCGRLQAFPGFP